jgi:hypothetical protein
MFACLDDHGHLLVAEVRVPRTDIEALQPSDTSLMPQGLEKTMSPQEFSDLLEFLHRRR